MMIILLKLGKQEKEFIKKITTKLLKNKILNVIIKEKRGLLMIDIEKNFQIKFAPFWLFSP